MAKQAQQAVRTKIAKLIKAGRVKSRYPISINLKDPDWTVTVVRLENAWGKWRKIRDGKKIGNDGGFCLSWGTVSAGFGELTFYLLGNKLYCDSECLGKEFVRKVLDKFMSDLLDRFVKAIMLR